MTEPFERGPENRGFAYVPVYRAVKADGLTPVDILRRLNAAESHCFMLEQSSTDEKGAVVWNRWSVVCGDPAEEIWSENGCLFVKKGTNAPERRPEDPVTYLAAELKKHTSPHLSDPELPPFTGGYAGYFSYEYISLIEPTCRFAAGNTEGYRDFHLMFFDAVYAFDRKTERIYCIANVPAESGNEGRKRANARLDRMAALLKEKAPAKEHSQLHLTGTAEPLYGPGEHAAMVEKAKEYIRRGEVAQIVLSNGKSVPAEGSLVDTYALLRETDPTRYMCCFVTDDVQAAMASPEPIARIRSGVVMTERLAGTVARGRTPEEDAARAEALKNDPKSVDEHNMLVDDSRNEFGFVSRIGTVKVEGYLNVVRTSRVMSLGSIITGELKPDKNALDVINAIVPSGAVSGAPKIRSCEVINAIEGDRRGLYGSAVGMIGMNGDADLFVFIRSAFLKNGKVTVRAGGGIIIDSDPEEEYNEALFKADAMLKTVERSREAVQ